MKVTWTGGAEDSHGANNFAHNGINNIETGSLFPSLLTIVRTMTGHSSYTWLRTPIAELSDVIESPRVLNKCDEACRVAIPSLPIPLRIHLCGRRPRNAPEELIKNFFNNNHQPWRRACFLMLIRTDTASRRALLLRLPFYSWIYRVSCSKTIFHRVI